MLTANGQIERVFDKFFRALECSTSKDLNGMLVKYGVLEISLHFKTIK